jgi:asparagine synthase (glutamine-hydrolysing)
MCGIVAAHGPFDHPTCQAMLDRIVHRGPDGQGHVTVGEAAWLGHRRLAIVDVEGGEQPFRTGDGTAAMTANGEIYNHRQLRRRIGSNCFASRSDNEVALHLYLAEGTRGLGALRGMFALVIATEDGRFVATRDPLGIKPLYWARHDGAMLFASELRAFPEPWRPYVEEFPPGYAWSSEEGLVRVFDELVSADEPVPAPDDELPTGTIEAIRDGLIAAVEERMMADVPVGVFLSGGLDSSLVAAIAARAAARQGETLSSFAVGLSGSADILAARRVAEHLGTEHHEWLYEAEDLLAALPDTIRCIESFDPMLVHSAVSNHLLARFTAQHVKVVLTGEGADELFAGYDYHRDLEDPAELHRELVRTVGGLHNLNLQRCDRVTMAHGLEARVPFLDTSFVGLALRIPAGLKQATAQRPEKWLLRTAFDGWLPDDLLWRRKEQFGDGTGASTILREAIELDGLDRLDGRDDVPPLRTAEEATYWRVFDAHLEGVRSEDVVGRFAVA